MTFKDYLEEKYPLFKGVDYSEIKFTLKQVIEDHAEYEIAKMIFDKKNQEISNSKIEAASFDEGEE